MPAPSTTWDMVRVFGTWHGQDGTLLAGNYTVTIPARVTDVTDDTIIPAGTFATGALNTTSGLPSLDVDVPATDDPDIAETGWKVIVKVTFTGGAATETYTIDVPYADRPSGSGGTGNGVNLRTVVLASTVPQTDALYKVGVAGGLAQLNSDGLVIDANGDPVTGGTGGSVTSADITDATVIGVDLLTAADAPSARTAIGAGTSSLALGTTSTTALAGNTAFVAPTRTVAGHALSADVTLAKGDVGLGSVDNTADASKAVLSATKLATARTINGVSFDGTANITVADSTKVPTTTTVAGHALSANVTLVKGDVGLGNVDNTADTAKPVSTAQQSALDGKLNTDDVLGLANLPAGSVFGRIYTGSAWPARGTSRTDLTCQYFALTAADPTPSDFVAGVDYLFLPAS